MAAKPKGREKKICLQLAWEPCFTLSIACTSPPKERLLFSVSQDSSQVFLEQIQIGMYTSSVCMCVYVFVCACAREVGVLQPLPTAQLAPKPQQIWTVN